MASFIAAYYDSEDTNNLSMAGIDVQGGDLIAVWGKNENANATITFSDNAAGGSNTYTKLTKITATGNAVNSQIAWAIAKAAETLTVSISFSSGAYKRGIVWVARPASGFSFEYDNSAQATNESANPSSGSYSVAGAGFAVAGFGEYSFGTWTAGSGWTGTPGNVDNSYGEYRILSGSGTITGNATHASMVWTANSAAWKEVSKSSIKIPKFTYHYQHH